MNGQINMETIIVQYLNGTITDLDYQVLIEWINESEDNLYEFDQIREIWLASQKENIKFDTEKAFERFKNKALSEAEANEAEKSKGKKISLRYHWVAAASILLLIAGGIITQLVLNQVDTPNTQLAYQEIIVPYGARSSVKLQDGSVITLNAGSTLRYNSDFGKKRRDLWLDGEGYFVVSKSKTPFVVHSGTVQVKALGTEFNVRAYSSEKDVVTTLVQGRVMIKDKSLKLSENGRPEITLLPNQKLTIKNGIKQIEYAAKVKKESSKGEPPGEAASQPVRNEIVKQDKIDPLPDISWKDNEWIIYRETLYDLSIKMERRFDINIVFEKEILKDYRYTGTLPDESLEQVLKVLAIVSPIQYKVEGKTVTFIEKEK